MEREAAEEERRSDASGDGAEGSGLGVRRRDVPCSRLREGHKSPPRSWVVTVRERKRELSEAEGVGGGQEERGPLRLALECGPFLSLKRSSVPDTYVPPLQ